MSELLCERIVVCPRYSPLVPATPLSRYASLPLRLSPATPLSRYAPLPLRPSPRYAPLPATPLIQELLGHSDIATTMIYTHVLARPDIHVVSPLDRLMSSQPAKGSAADRAKFGQSTTLAARQPVGVEPVAIDTQVAIEKSEISSIQVVVSAEVGSSDRSRESKMTSEYLDVSCQESLTASGGGLMSRVGEALKWPSGFFKRVVSGFSRPTVRP